MATLVGFPESPVRRDATERRPRAPFDSDLGVLRRTWWIAFRSYGVRGIDRHPPCRPDTGDSEPQSREDRS
ncbi:hypothetical protein [Streptomyces mirabilis]|jgi:hypothetical protein|uniref:Uncharacterized protein n=1 Tax=Streptomyces mirabilis TaxID=68239 RepID=A0A1I2NCB8_9ACTN|nr:hypothetical protein [Streptomyces mirabilis]SFF99116.1 hypothetical protein SAMN02787118_114217 [Streptomyces mirabilis]